MGDEKRPDPAREGPEDRHLAGEGLRQAAVDALSEAFAQDAIGVEEFERRVELAHRAETAAELRVLLSDIPRAEQLPAPRPGSAPEARRGTDQGIHEVGFPVSRRALATHVPDQAVVAGVLGGGVRRGRWHPARYTYALGVLGGAELDFRECALPPVTNIRCFAIMGGVQIIVPPDVIVESSGVGIMGAFEHIAGDEDLPADAPIIRVSGLAMMGGVEVTVRYPGETAGDARRRLREERRERRRLKRGS